VSTKPTQQIHQTPTQPQTTPIQTITPTPIHTPKSTPFYTPTPTPTPPKGSLGNPAVLDETLVVRKLGGTFEITVLEYQRGDKTTQKVLEANMFNKEPTEGYEYLLVKLRVKYAEGSESTYLGSFRVYVDGGGFDQELIVWPKGMNELGMFKKLLPDGQTEGWLAFIVPKGKNVPLAYEILLEAVGFIEIPS